MPKKKEETAKKEKTVVKKSIEPKKHPKKLYRSITDRVIGGVCGGIAEYFEVDSTLVRLAFVLFTLTVKNGSGLLIYLILWLVVPVRKSEEVKEVLIKKRGSRRHSLTTAILLILIGLIFLFNNFGILSWSVWEVIWKIWPVFLILFGLEMLIGKKFLGKAVMILLIVILSLALIGFLFSLSNQNFSRELQKRLPFWQQDKLEQWFKIRKERQRPRVELDFLEEVFPPNQV